MTIELLEKYLMKVCTKETCYLECRNIWSNDNPTIGHCAIVSLIVNDFFNGDIYKTKVGTVSHYFNCINNNIIDLTASQFKHKIDYSNKIRKDRSELINDRDTSKRYNLLKQKLELLLIDNEINKCKLCSNMVEKFPNSKTVSIGKRSDIVILGEAPANNGWRKSGVAWYDINHKLLPSGIILQKLLKELNLQIEDTYFLEAIKCYPKDRKYLNKCSNNCKEYLNRQLSKINPKIILSLGDAATKSILNFKYTKFSEVVGKEFNVNGYKIIPIYHPSPISPKSYKGNIEIFQKIKESIMNI